MSRPKIDHDLCTLCELCVELCPRLAEEGGMILVSEEDCGECQDCVNECPLWAISKGP